MATVANAQEVMRALCKVRQVRQYRPDRVADDVVAELLELARWTGSSRNTQPWHFIVVTDKEQLHQLSRLREVIHWVADAPLAIVLVLNGASAISEAYDEGRLSERLLIGAHLLGLGGGTAWFVEEEQQRRAKELLGVPAERTLRSLVALGYPTTTKDPRPNPAVGGRRPLPELVSYGRFGQAPA